MAKLESRVSVIESDLKELAWAQRRNEMFLESFSQEMETFKEEGRREREERRRDRLQMNKKWGDLANKMGTVVEDIILPGFPGILKRYFEVEADSVVMRTRVRHPHDRGRVREFDIIAVAGERLFLDETKSNPRQEYLDMFVRTKEEVFDYLPHYAGKQLVPIFSSLNLPVDAIGYLTKNGCYAMMVGDEHLDIVNFEEVRLTRSSS